MASFSASGNKARSIFFIPAETKPQCVGLRARSQHLTTSIMKLTTHTLTVLSLLALGTSIAVAQDGAPKGEGSGNRLAEFLKRADADNDGKISKGEFEEFAKKDTGDRFSKMDVNADGFVDKTEMSQIAERMREGIKGRTSGEGGFRRPGGESEGFRRPPGESKEGDKPMPKPEGDRPMPRPEGERPQGDRPQGGPPGGPGGPGAFNLDEVYGRMDKNADGSVDKMEYAEFSKQEIESRFNRMDENQDGKVSKEEMKSGMERMRNMMRGGPGGQGGPGSPGGPGGSMRRPGGEGGEGGGFRRPPSGEGGSSRPRPESEGEAPKKDPA
jgi:Ca2+-binding EF-hand superfamily protein